MIPVLSIEHKERLKEIHKKLQGLSSYESSFAEMENLFYEVLSILRNYGNDDAENAYLADLKTIEGKEYKLTQERYKKSSQRERVIKQFKNSFRVKLHSWI